MKRTEYNGVWIDPTEVREWVESGDIFDGDDLDAKYDEYLEEIVSATEEKFPNADIVICHPSKVATHAASGWLPSPYRETPFYDVVAEVSI